MGVDFLEGEMFETQREYAADYRKPPLHTRFKKGQSGNPRGRPAKNLPALLAAALNEKISWGWRSARHTIFLIRWPPE
jgi:hypothetical protein